MAIYTHVSKFCCVSVYTRASEIAKSISTARRKPWTSQTWLRNRRSLTTDLSSKLPINFRKLEVFSADRLEKVQESLSESLVGRNSIGTLLVGGEVSIVVSEILEL